MMATGSSSKSQRLRVFSQVGLKIQEAPSVDDIFNSIGEGLKEIGFVCVILLLDEKQKHLIIEYSSVYPSVVARLEKLLGIKAIGFKVPIGDVAAFATAVREKRAIFSARPTEVLKKALPSPFATLASQAIRILSVGNGIAAPLMARGKILGVLDVSSREISEEDIPIVVAFANHTAIAIDNAWLRAGLEARAKELEVSEEKYKLLLEDINDGYILYQDGRIVLANQRFAEIYGYEQGQVLGQALFKFVAPDSLQAVKERYERIVGGEEAAPEKYEVMGIKGDGTIIPVELSIKLIQYEGKPAFSAIFRDITERKRIEEALLESEQHHRVLIEMASNLGEGIVIVEDNKDEPVTIAFTNNAVSKILGYSREELLQMSLRDLVAPAAIQDIRERYLPRWAGEKIEEHYESLALAKDGTVVPIQVEAGSTIYQGKPAIVAFFRDITEGKVSKRKSG